MYRIETASRRVDREIADLPITARERVIAALRQLANDPYPDGSRKLSGEMRGAWRIRVGDYRVLFDVNDEDRVVVILAVLHRRDAYR